MEKRKTALARLEEYLKNVIETENTEFDKKFELGIRYVLNSLPLFKPQEKQDLIDAYLEGAMDSPLNSPNDAKLYFEDTFENEN